MTSNGDQPDLDFSALLPAAPFDVKIGEKHYQLTLDMPAVLHARIRRWVAQLPDLDEQEAERESVEYVARVLRIDTAEAESFGPMAREGLLLFLVGGKWLPRTTRPSNQPSGSSGRTTEA